MDAVRCFIKDSHLHLQQIEEALRKTVIYRTGYTANKMMLGRELNIPAYLMFPVPAEEHQDIEREYIYRVEKESRDRVEKIERRERYRRESRYSGERYRVERQRRETKRVKRNRVERERNRD